MALKETWKDLEDAVANVPNSGSDLTVKPINEIAHAVIELEEQDPDEITIDNAMSDESKNPVQNKVIKKYVDDTVGEISYALDELHEYAQSLINGGDAS